MADIGIKIRATDETKGAFDSVGRGLGTIQTSAAGVAGALASLGVGVSVGGFLAMTKQIVDGLDAMNDLKDATGASIENISALEDVARRTGASFDTVSTALIKLNQGLNSAKPGSDTEAAINAIGLSVKDLKDLDPAEAFRQIAAGLSGFADDANKARITQELFGKSLKEIAPLLKDVAENGALNGTVTAAQAEAAEKLNKQLFSLQKNALDLGRAFTSTLIPAIADGVDRFILANKHAGGLLNTLAMYLRLDYSKNVQGNLGEVEKQIAQLEQRATRITSSGAMAGNDKMIADLKAQAAYLKELRQANILAEQGDNSDAITRRYMTPKQSIGNLPDKSAAKEAAAAAAKALADQNKELAAQAKLMAENAGLTGTFAQDWDRLGAIFKKGGYNLDQLTEAQAKLLAGQPGIKAAHDAEAKAAAATEKAAQAALDARQKYNEYLDQGLASVQAENQTIQDQIDRLGLNKEAIAELDANRLESQAITQDLIVLKKIEQGIDADQYDIYVKTAAALRNQAALKRSLAGKETALESGKETAKATFDEWKRGWEETDRLARDAFTGWAENGTSMAEAIGKSLKKALLSAIYEATLKPIAFQLYTSIMGGAPGGAGGAAGNTIGTIANAASIYNTVSGGMAGIGANVAGFGNLIGSANIASYGAGMGLSTGAAALAAEEYMIAASTAMIEGNAALAASYTGVAESLTAGASSTSSLASIAANPATWAVLGLAAVASLQAFQGGETTQQIGSGIKADLGAGGASGVMNTITNKVDHRDGWGNSYTNAEVISSAASAGVSNYIDSAVLAMTAATKGYSAAIGLSADAVDGFTKQIDVSLTGMNPDQQKAAIDKALSGFVDDMVTAAFGSTITSLTKEGETSSAALQRLAVGLTTVNSVFEIMGAKLMDIGLSGASASDALVNLMGGLDAFKAATAAYYANFYSKDEQRTNTVKQINTALTGTGFDANTADRAAFRKLVDAQDLTTESGRKMYATLMSVQGAFAGITTESADAVQALDKVATARKDAANAAYTSLVASINAEKSRVTLMRDLARESVDTLQGVFDLLKSSVADLYGSVDSTVAMQAKQGSDFITQALSAAQTTGYLPDQTQLADAISGARGGVDAAIYASQQDADFARLELAGRLDQLKNISGDQLSDAKKALNIAQGQLDALGLLVDSAKAQLDAALGLNIMIQSLGEAMGYFEKAIGDLGTGATTGTKKGSSAGEVSFGGGSSPGAGVADPKYSQKFNVAGFGIANNWITDPAEVARLDSINAYINTVGVASVADIQTIAKTAMEYGVSQQEIANATGYLLDDINKLFSGAGVPAFAVGTNYVPRDMLAQIHEGEAIVPKAYNPAAGNGSASVNTERLEALVEALTAEVIQLRGQVSTTNEHASRTANAVEGNQSRPLLVEIAA